jgi:UDP-2,3-diacylglucosamine pyrophosphatase LpxH
MPKKIVVTSDQHLGYENSNDKDFKNFLDFLCKRDDVQSLILLGDVVDMWRRDVSGIFLQFSDIVAQLAAIYTSKKMDVYIVAGNHDYHLLKLESPGYQFKFYKELLPCPTLSSITIVSDDLKYSFRHGWEFDLAQQPIIMEAMCHNLSDEAGRARSSIYNILQVAKDQFSKELNEIIDFHNKKGNGYVDNLLTPPEMRLDADVLSDVEKKAYFSVGEGERLVFGHTHRPFISKDKKVINSGCWVKDAKCSNTFLEIQQDDVKMFQFNSDRNIVDITNDHYYDLK